MYVTKQADSSMLASRDRPASLIKNEVWDWEEGSELHRDFGERLADAILALIDSNSSDSRSANVATSSTAMQ